MDSYKKLFLMIGASALLMYVSTYLNTYEFDHIFYSQTRLYMTLIMSSIMAVVMLVCMSEMYTNTKMNRIIYLGSGALFVLAIFLVRNQTFIGDVKYMEAMIPHHSIAILTSENADIADPRVRELADGIIKTQKEEIAQMKRLIKELKQ